MLEEQIRNYLVQTTVDTLGITEHAARLRIKALMQSGILFKFGTPDQQSFQIAVDAAMQIPQLGESEIEGDDGPWW